MSYNKYKVNINCYSFEKTCFLVSMYDKCGECIFSSYTNRYGRLSIPINNIGNYRISVRSDCNQNPISQTSWISINKLGNYMKYFIFTSNIKEKTFILTDKNYKNLPIEKGEIILWHNIQLT